MSKSLITIKRLDCSPIKDRFHQSFLPSNKSCNTTNTVTSTNRPHIEAIFNQQIPSHIQIAHKPTHIVSIIRIFCPRRYRSHVINIDNLYVLSIKITDYATSKSISRNRA